MNLLAAELVVTPLLQPVLFSMLTFITTAYEQFHDKGFYLWATCYM